MTDYTKNEDYAAKDALATGDPEKLILGTDVGGEFDEIVTAIATKYDSTDIASQAQAIAGASNTTLITPLRLAQALAGLGGGMLEDISALADPNADRILFWDDSAGAVELLTASTGLTISGVTMTTNDAQIVHSALSGYDANQHVDHTAVSIGTSEGIQGGGTIDATRALKLDISGLTTETIDPEADYTVFFDATDSTHKKTLATSVAGTALGDGAWYHAGQALSAGVEDTVIYTTASYNSLQRGTFNTSTGIYTAGADGARIDVSVIARVTLIGNGHTLKVRGYHNSTEKAYDSAQNYADSTSTELSAGFTMSVTLAAGDTFTIKATASSAATLTSGEQYNRLRIVELA